MHQHVAGRQLAGQIKTTPEMLRVYRKGRGLVEEIVALELRDGD